MKFDKLPILKALSDDELREQIPNWDWFKNLKIGDLAIIWLDDCMCFSDELVDFGYTLSRVIAVHPDGAVEVDKGNLGKFYYCRLPNEMDATIALIPPRKEYLEEIESYDFIRKLVNMEQSDWKDIGYDKLKTVIKIIED